MLFAVDRQAVMIAFCLECGKEDFINGKVENTFEWIFGFGDWSARYSLNAVSWKPSRILSYPFIYGNRFLDGAVCIKLQPQAIALSCQIHQGNQVARDMASYTSNTAKDPEAITFFFVTCDFSGFYGFFQKQHGFR